MKKRTTPQIHGTKSGIILVLGILYVMIFLYPTAVMAGTPDPPPDRLAEPERSQNPTQYEEGRYLYWMHCMPCHGDFGQGLTKEFIELWPEDHQNCWGRGCHGGRAMDEGFPIPKSVPAIISDGGKALAFSNSEDLYNYLFSTHPPQSPGYLQEEEYWAMTAYVLAENNLQSPELEIGPYEQSPLAGYVTKGFGFVLVAILFWYVAEWMGGDKNHSLRIDQ